VFNYVFSCAGNVVSAYVGGDVAAAEEEAVDRVDGVRRRGGGVVKPCAACGVGGEGSKEAIEVWLVGAVGGESGCVWAFMVEVSCSSFSSGLAKKGTVIIKEKTKRVVMQRLKQGNPTIVTNAMLLICSYGV
jgi:hypothetical protein